MKDLLMHWYELEPDRFLYYESDGIFNILRKGEWRYLDPEDPNEDLVLGAIIEAIQLRPGLRWSMGLGGETIHWWYSQIDKYGRVLGSWESESSESHVIAILSTYLETLFF